MLNVLEDWLNQAVRPALPPNLTLIVGPMLPPAATATPLLNIAATGLHPTRKSRSDDQDGGDPAYVTHRLTLPGDGKTLEFALPEDTGKDVLEVEWTPGRLAKRGDDYQLNEDKLYFYRAPPADFTLLLRSSSQIDGYQQVSRCRVVIEINAWAAQAAAADELLTSALASALAALASVDRIELARIEAAGFSLRLLNPRTELAAIERAAVAGEPPLCRCTARLSLYGELELTLALGLAPATGRINEIFFSIPSVPSKPE